MSTHPVLTEEQITTMVHTIVNARYDSVSDFLTKLSEAFMQDASMDELRGNRQLAQHLSKLGVCILESRYHCNDAWKICKHKMGVK